METVIKAVLLLVFCGLAASQHHYVAPHYIEKNVYSVDPYHSYHHTPPIDPYSKYSFGYAVHDPYTGLPHNRHEVKEGPVIKGQYQLVEHDGSLRTVSYTADDYHGFQAVVDKGPLPVRDLQKYGRVF